MQRRSDIGDIGDIAEWKVINDDASVDLKKKILMQYLFIQLLLHHQATLHRSAILDGKAKQERPLSSLEQSPS
jgi:hypothetical protein